VASGEGLHVVESRDVVAPGDDLFARVESLLDDDALRSRMGRAAREFARGLSWDTVLDDLTDLHARLAGIQSSYVGATA
jgi:glycosyltransferase involved in cell wall biosynthesis